MSVFRSFLSRLWRGHGDQQEHDDESQPPPSLPTGSDQHQQRTPSGVDGGHHKEPVTTRVPGKTPSGFVRGSKNRTSDVDGVVTSSMSSAPRGLSSSLQESKISTSTVQDRKSSSAPSGSVSDKKSSSTPSGSVPDKKSSSTASGSVPDKKSSSTTSGYVPKKISTGMPSGSVPVKRPSSTPSASGPDKKSSSTPSGSVPDKKSSSTPSASGPDKKSSSTPSGSVPDKTSSSTPSGSVRVKRPSTTPSASGPNKKSSSTLSGSVPDRKSSKTKYGSVPDKKSSSTPSGSVPDKKSSSTPSGSVPVKRPSSTPFASGPDKKSSSTPSGSVPDRKSSNTTSGSVPKKNSTSMPSGSVPDRKSPSKLSGSVPVKRPSSTPSGSSPERKSSGTPSGSVPVKKSSSTPSGSVPQKKSSGLLSGSVPVKTPSSTPSGSVSVKTPSSKPADSVPEKKSSAPGGSKNGASHDHDRDPHLGGSNTDGKTHRKRPCDPPYAADISPKLPRTYTREAPEIHAFSRAATSGHSRDSTTQPSPEECAVRTTAASAATTVNTRPVVGDLRALMPAADTSETPSTDTGMRLETPALVVNIDVSDSSDSDTELSPEAPSVSAPPATAMPVLRRPDHDNLSSAAATNMTTGTSALLAEMLETQRLFYSILRQASEPSREVDNEQNMADIANRLAAGALRTLPTSSAPAKESVCDKYGIPAAPVRPVRERIWDLENVTEVFFDIKTSGLHRGQKITQIAAVRADGGTINLSVLPDVPQAGPQSAGLWQGAQQVSDGGSFHDLSLRSALEKLCNFLAQKQNNVLVGHNIRTVHSNVLFHALGDCGLLDRFCEHVIGFVDTMKLFKQTHRNLQTHGQQELVRNILGKEYNVHDAMAAAYALQQLLQGAGITPDIKRDASYSTRYSMDRFLEALRAEKTLASFDVLVNFRHKVLSPFIAKKIAGSGLSVQHLEKVYRKGGKEGLKEVFSEKTEGNARVNVQSQTITGIAKHFDRTSLPGHSSAAAVCSTPTGHI